MKYRKKPVVIDAWRNLPNEEVPSWMYTPNVFSKFVAGLEIRIATLEGIMTANVGDWIIRGVKGEVYPCKPDIFEATYEKAEE